MTLFGKNTDPGIPADKMISKEHLIFKNRNNKIHIIDNNSTNW